MPVPNFMAINTEVVETFQKYNDYLIVVLKEKSGDPQSH